MSRTSIFIYALLIGICAALIIFWYAVGFPAVASPINIVISVVGLLLMVLAGGVTVSMERHRRESIRNIYVGEASMFNSELGEIDLTNSLNMEKALADALGSLEYGWQDKQTRMTRPPKSRCLVRSKAFKGQENWCGEVIIPLGRTSRTREFSNSEELADILATI